MAIRAQQLAFLGLRAQSSDAACVSTAAETERLARRIAVVEVQRSHATVISAADASPPGLGDEDALDLAPSPHDRLRTTGEAAVPATSLQLELGDAVAAAGHRPVPNAAAAAATGLAQTPSASRPQSVARKMLAHRRQAYAEVPRELANGGIASDQTPKLVDIDRPRRVLQPPYRLEFEPARNLADGRTIDSFASADLSERESLRQ
jgi:hypothetical protein